MKEILFEINGAIDHYGWQRYMLKSFLAKNAGTPVRIIINSFGGAVNEAIIMAQLLKDHGNATVEFRGMCASAATFLALGAKSREMQENSLWLAHKSSIPVNVYGHMNADQIEDAIKNLQKEKKNQDAFDLVIAKMYLQACENKGKTLEDVFNLMKEARWLLASEVLEWGFIDKIIPAKPLSAEVQAMHVEACAEFNLPTPAFTVDDEKKNDDTLADSFFAKLKSLFTPKVEDNVNTNPNNNSNNMDKNAIKTVLALLALDTLVPNAAGNVELSAEQLTKIENALAEGQRNKTELDAAASVLDSLSDSVKNITGVSNKAHAIKAVVDRIPTGVPAAAVAPTTTPVDYSTEAVDPINQFFN